MYLVWFYIVNTCTLCITVPQNNFDQTLTCTLNRLSFHYFAQEVNEIWYLKSLTITHPEYSEFLIIQNGRMVSN